jgi:Asp-tRNA(Asn)/Glu-tRNA(Gln) amidotransferase A subunit family amidase
MFTFAHTRLFRSGLAVMLGSLWLTCVSTVSAEAEGKKFNVVEATVADIHAAFQAHTLTAHQLLQMYLDRIAAYDKKGPAINCVISLNPKAMEEADRLDAAFAKSGFVGPLHGIPILVKDEIDAAGMPTTLGTTEFKDYRPPLDAFAVAKLRSQGAIVVGKTTLSEFAAGDTFGSMFGVSHNPYALERTVGGSSGGSGGSLAANFATLAIGEETSSSLRRPASWCSLAGLRPTPGLISRSGMWDGAPNPLAQMGPMGRTVTDVAIMLDGMVGYDPDDPITAMGIMHTPKTYTAFLDKNGLQGARIGVIREPLSPNSDPAADDFKRIDALFQNALDELHAHGATVMDVTIPDLKELMAHRATDPKLADESLHVYLSRNPDSKFKTRADIDNDPEMAKSYRARLAAARADGAAGRANANAKGKARGGYGGGTTAEAQLAVIQAREQLMLNIAKVMADNHLDALAYKAVEHEPLPVDEEVNPPYKQMKGVVALNTFLIYASTITVPMGFTNNDTLPSGLAFLGLPYAEPTLIKLAYAYEQATHHRRPPASTPALVQ